MIVSLLYGLLTWTMAQAISTSWNPSFSTPAARILHPVTAIYQTSPEQTFYDAGSTSLLAQREQDACALYKVAMKQQFYFEVRKFDGIYIKRIEFQIKNRISDL